MEMLRRQRVAGRPQPEMHGGNGASSSTIAQGEGKGGEAKRGEGGKRGGEGGAPNRPTNHPADSPPPTYLLPSPPRPRPPPPPTIPPHPPDGHDAHAHPTPHPHAGEGEEKGGCERADGTSAPAYAQA